MLRILYICSTKTRITMARVILLTDFTENYGNKLLKGMIKYCRDHKSWSLFRMNGAFLESKGIEGLLEFAISWKADAIIGEFREGDDLQPLLDHGIITFALDNESRPEGVCNIVGDHENAGRICADYLIKKGFRNFAFFGWSKKAWSNERLFGFESEIRELVPKCTFTTRDSMEETENWWEYIEPLREWLLSLPKPVAILACHDRAAFHIMEACKLDDTGALAIPSEVSVLSIDNDEAICLLCTPQLSSLNQNVEQAGYSAVAAIDRLMKKPLPERMSIVPDNIVVKHTYIITRNSTNAFQHDNKYVNKTLEYIDRHIGEPIHVEDIVETLPISRRLLETTFKESMSCSIYQYIIDSRVEKIKQLIRNGATTQEALSSINVDKRTLANCFKQATGLTPLKYEQEFGLKEDA